MEPANAPTQNGAPVTYEAVLYENPKVVKAFWHHTATLAEVDGSVGIAPFVAWLDEASEEPTSVYLHLIAEHLMHATTQRFVQAPTTLHVDLIAFDEEELLRLFTAAEGDAQNDLRDRVQASDLLEEDQRTIAIDLAALPLAPGGGPVTAEAAYWGEAPGGGTPMPVTLDLLGAAPEGDDEPRYFHVCIEVRFSETQRERLKDVEAGQYGVVAWAWVRNAQLEASYARELGIPAADFSSREARLDLLLDRRQFDAVVQKRTLWGSTYSTRSAGYEHFDVTRAELDAAPLPPDAGADVPDEVAGLKPLFLYDDALAFDEPTANALRLSRYLPVTACSLHKPYGRLGLSGDQRDVVVSPPDWVRGSSPWSRTEPPEAPELWVRGSLGRQTNELHDGFEHQFLLRPGSVAEWLYSMERIVWPAGRPQQQPARSVVFRGDHRPFSEPSPLSKLDTVTYTFSVGGRPHARLGAHALDFAKAETIAVPRATLRDADGRARMLLGKGFPSAQPARRFTERTHTRIQVPGFGTEPWHAHPYAHRPLILRYRLRTALTEAQLERWNADPPLVCFVDDALLRQRRASAPYADRRYDNLAAIVAPNYLDPDPPQCRPDEDGHLDVRCTDSSFLCFPLRLAPEQAAQGDHVVLLYPIALTGRYHATVVSRGLFPSERPTLGEIVAPSLDVPLVTQERFNTYRPTADPDWNGGDEEPHALFEGNPVVSVERRLTSQIRAGHADRAQDLWLKAQSELIAGTGAFVLGLLPGGWSVIGPLFGAGVKWIYEDRPPTGREWSTYTNKVFGGLLKELKGQTPPDADGSGIAASRAARKAAREAAQRRAPRLEWAGVAQKGIGAALDVWKVVESVQKAYAAVDAHLESKLSPLALDRPFGDLEGDQTVTLMAHGRSRLLRDDDDEGLTWGEAAWPFEVLLLNVRAVAQGREAGMEAGPFLYAFGPGGGYLEWAFPDADALPEAGAPLDAQAALAQGKAALERGLSGARTAVPAMPSLPVLKLPHAVADAAALADALPGRLAGVLGGSARQQQHVLAQALFDFDRAAYSVAQRLGVTGREPGGGLALEGLFANALALATDAVAQRALGFSARFSAVLRAHGGSAPGGLRAVFAGGPPSDGAAGVLAALDHLGATRLVCPKCGLDVSWDWGWCPHHATPRGLRERGNVDTDHDGEVSRDEFMTFVRTDERIVGQTLFDHLDRPVHDPSRLLVHWTEFEAVRGAGSLADASRDSEGGDD